MKNIFPFLKNIKNSKQKLDLLIVSDEKEALVARDCAKFFGYEPFLLPDFRANYGDDLLSFSGELVSITKELGNYHKYKKANKLLISPIRTITHKLPKSECFDSFDINFGDKLDLNELKSKLFNWGYYFVDIVTSGGEVSFRGDIIDIAIDDEDGYRISLFDDECESIRRFSLEDQKSNKDELETITITPSFLSLNEENYETINQKVQNDTSNAFVKDIHSLGFWHLDELGIYYTKELLSSITPKALMELEEVYIFDDKRVPKDDISALKHIPLTQEYNEVKPANIKEFLSFHTDKKVTLISSSEAKIKGVELSLDDENIKYIYDDMIINLVSKDEVIISLNTVHKKKKAKRARLVIDELQVGDFVVHQTHGIGKFIGVEPVRILGSTRDFVVITYAGEDRLLIPVENLDSIDRFVADSGSVAVLDKLGKGSFAKIKESVKDKLFAIAKDIIALAATRELEHGIKIKIDTLKLQEFQQSCGFEYTADQIRSINELVADLGSGLVMDRLLSGDVGFGKTEVAMNAMYLVANSGYQSIFVCPTSLLANQHYHSIKNRFEPFGIKVAKLDGKTTAKEKSLLMQRLGSGEVQVVVGTHSLLNITPPNLALVIIDEEHKFGVKQKEKLKSITKNVHLFSMSATPIPRTLNLALSKIKGMSALSTPPKERIGTRTFVKEYDDKLIKEIILREKRRGGQLFYVYNNIATIKDKQYEISKIVPNLKIDIIHSQIPQKESEEILENFTNGKSDILLATSIVESGLHLPNANSIIIDGADRFGIADLHQLRGRVGRSDKEGFCYFLVEDKSKITSDAIKRLVALESNSYLGSGTALAFHDLEIRGGGNIIGEAQSGQIKQIGYALYIKMLEDAISLLSGESKVEEKSVDIKLTISAYISSDYISEDRLRLELYRRLSRAKTKEEVYEIENEMEDRFGKIDITTRQFLELILIKIKALDKGIKTISNYEQNITIVYNDGKKETIKTPSKDDDDIINTTMKFLNS
ncbi:transcription-repair coupling factor [Arcobacter sp. FWKO B]|uniref:transcription-repair coupling factor n=1 Tax=Arcobacter sp. FWKO B TaxID=2593672 RepID=UPI0018A4FB7B|nr:transcription-repair coupling factor [Arcobacter sp. FWKO B]QOG12101.1 transcription-repair coupling factor [Arcobacter sp. FWKO B]